MREPSNRRSPALVLAASALGLTFAAPMTAWANEAAERLTERLDPLENYHATFEQQILDGGGERLQSAVGKCGYRARVCCVGKLKLRTRKPWSLMVKMSTFTIQILSK